VEVPIPSDTVPEPLPLHPPDPSITFPLPSVARQVLLGNPGSFNVPPLVSVDGHVPEGVTLPEST
jgi:hypothetical protein